jgi:hypothetical protein
VEVERAAYLYAVLNEYTLFLILAVAVGVVRSFFADLVRIRVLTHALCACATKRALLLRWACSDSIADGK